MMARRTIKHLMMSGRRLFVDKNYRRMIIAAYRKTNSIPDEIYIPQIYYANTGRVLDLSNPRGFNEKLQWLKLHDRKPVYTIMSDKYQVKHFVSEKIGSEHVVPCLGVWEKAADIDFQSLPNQFVLKCNHNSGLGMCICKDKSKLDIDKVRRELERGLQQDYYVHDREWSYKDIPRRIIAEKYMVDNAMNEEISNLRTEGLIDYKFYCFDGEPKFLYVGFANMANGSKHDLMTFLMMDWKPAPFYRKDHDPMPYIPEKPKCFDEMVVFAKILSKGVPFVRVDFFLVDNSIFFSEFTFVPGGGYGLFFPEEWEKKIGDWLVLREIEDGK